MKPYFAAVAIIAVGATAYVVRYPKNTQINPAQVVTPQSGSQVKNGQNNPDLSTPQNQDKTSANANSLVARTSGRHSNHTNGVASHALTEKNHNKNNKASLNNDTQTPFYLPESEKPVLPANYREEDLSPVNGEIVAGVVKNGPTMEATENAPSGDDYSFPAVIESENGSLTMVIGDEQLPNHSDRRQLRQGDGPEVALGDKVRIHYDMFSWATGKLIESTRSLEEQTLEIIIGDHEVPNVLQNALLNRTVGSRMQVVFEKSLTDLPQYMNQHDGYVLVVDIEEVVSAADGLKAFEIGAGL